MTELNDFIAEALTSVVRGIRQAQDRDVGDHIGPLIQGERGTDYGNFHLRDDPAGHATVVQFDVQVAIDGPGEGGRSSKRRARLFVVDADTGDGGRLPAQAGGGHRLQFSVPVRIPRRANAQAAGA